MNYLARAGRNYEWTLLAEKADFLVIMAYDMQAQIWGRCIASANDPLSQVGRGVTNDFIPLGMKRERGSLENVVSLLVSCTKHGAAQHHT